MGVSRFLYNNLFDVATVTASSEADDYPVEEIQTNSFKSTWRSTGVAAEWVKWDFGANVNIRDLIVKYHNIRVGATVKIQANLSATGDVWTTPDFEETLTVVAGQFVVKWATNKTYRWWRLTIADTGNPDGYLYIGRIFSGAHYAMSINFNYTFTDEPIDPSTIRRSQAGTIYSSYQEPYQRWVLTFENISETDYTTLKTIFKDYVGQRRAYFLCFDDAASPDETYYVENVSSWPFQHTPWSAFYNVTITIKEAQS